MASGKTRIRKQRQHIEAIAYDKRGREICRATNSYSKSHPIQHYFAKRAGKPGAIYLHAEIACLLRAGRNVIHRLEIVRINKLGKPALAAPCPICQLAIEAWGIKHVIHT